MKKEQLADIHDNHGQLYGSIKLKITQIGISWSSNIWSAFMMHWIFCPHQVKRQGSKSHFGMVTLLKNEQCWHPPLFIIAGPRICINTAQGSKSLQKPWGAVRIFLNVGVNSDLIYLAIGCWKRTLNMQPKFTPCSLQSSHWGSTVNVCRYIFS